MIEWIYRFLPMTSGLRTPLKPFPKNRSLPSIVSSSNYSSSPFLCWWAVGKRNLVMFLPHFIVYCNMHYDVFHSDRPLLVCDSHCTSLLWGPVGLCCTWNDHLEASVLVSLTYSLQFPTRINNSSPLVCFSSTLVWWGPQLLFLVLFLIKSPIPRSQAFPIATTSPI